MWSDRYKSYGALIHSAQMSDWEILKYPYCVFCESHVIFPANHVTFRRTSRLSNRRSYKSFSRPCRSRKKKSVIQFDRPRVPRDVSLGQGKEQMNTIGNDIDILLPQQWLSTAHFDCAAIAAREKSSGRR
jgi:hypothetical protein